MPAVFVNLENAVGSRKSAQAIDSSSYMKKVLITSKVTTHFFITLSKSIDCTSFSRPTAFSRVNAGLARSTNLYLFTFINNSVYKKLLLHR
jgi:hypothetical protein